MSKPETVKFELRRYNDDLELFENDYVAQLPGLLITQFNIESDGHGNSDDRVALRFDFIDDWYSIIAFLDEDKHSTGHFEISMQSPLSHDGYVWRGDDLILDLAIFPSLKYELKGEDDFTSAIEQGWIRIRSAAKVQEALHKLCLMLEDGCLPPEVMDAMDG